MKKFKTGLATVLTLLFISSALPLNVMAEDDITKALEEAKILNEETLSKLEEIKKSNLNTTDKGLELVKLYDTQVSEQQKTANQLSIIKIALEEENLKLVEKEKELKTKEAELEKKNKQLESKDKEIEKSEARRLEIEQEISDLNTNIERKIGMSEDLIRKIQIEEKSNNLLDVILNSKSISEAVSVMFNIQQIQKANVEIIEALKEDKALVETLEQEYLELLEVLKQEQKDISKVKKSFEEEKKALEKQQKELKKHIKTLDSEQKEYNKLSEESLDKLEEINKELLSVSGGLVHLNEELDKIKEKLDASTNAKEIKDIEDLQLKITEIVEKDTTVHTKSPEGITLKVDNLSEAQKRLVETAEKYLGVDYVWGGTAVDGLDCSGFTQRVFREAVGVEITRVTYTQQYQGKEVSVKDLQVGDLIFWGEPTHHVALYVGDGYYIHAPKPNDVVRYSNYDIQGASHIRRILK